MEAVVLNNIQCKIDLEKLREKLHLKENSSELTEIIELATEAQLIARPKVMFKKSLVESKGDNFVVIDGIKFTSRVLRVNLEDAPEVFPYIVTCGTELEVWSKQFDDYFVTYCVDTIKEMILSYARQEFVTFLEQEFGLGHAVNMNPGSLKDWPITEQKPLFQLLGDVEESIGVQLTDSYLLLPVKSVSGIRFPKQSTFENCQLCPRENCPSRKAPYSEEMLQQFQ